MFFKFKLLWLTIVVFFVVPCLADVSFDLDQIKRCDPVFCPSDTTMRADIDAAREHASRSGIIIESYNESSGIAGGVVTIQFNGDGASRPRNRGGAAADEVYDFENSSVSSVEDSTNSTGDSSSEDDSANPNQQGRFNQAQGPNSGNSGSGISGMNGGGAGGQTMVKGGLLYSNDDRGVGGGADFEKGSDPNTVKAESRPSGQSAVMLNRQNSAGGPTGGEDSERRGNSSRALASVGGGAGGGGFSASGGSGAGGAAVSGGSSRSGDGLLGRLAGIAKGLGERFFGMSGSGGSHAARMRASAALAEKNRLKKLAALSKNDPNFRDMLQKHMRRQRGLASSLEFGAKDSFLFGRVCQQYTKYANENGIPDDRVRCPNR